MTTYVTTNQAIATMVRANSLYAVTDISSPANCGGKLGFHTVYAKFDEAGNAQKRIIKSGQGRAHLTEILPTDTIEYVG